MFLQCVATTSYLDDGDNMHDECPSNRFATHTFCAHQVLNLYLLLNKRLGNLVKFLV
jgi:hypothetical protein